MTVLEVISSRFIYLLMSKINIGVDENLCEVNPQMHKNIASPSHTLLLAHTSFLNCVLYLLGILFPIT